MSENTEVGVFLAYAAGMLLVYIFGRFLITPLKWSCRILINSVLGGLAIIIINFLGAAAGVFVPLNVLTALVVGILGVPGAITLCIVFL